MKSLELRVPPLIQVFLMAVVMWTLSKGFPQLQLLFPKAAIFALLLAVIGSLITLLGGIEFRKAKTTINPLTPNKATKLVVSGPFRFTRNPMYLGLLIILSSWALYLENGAAFLILPIFGLYITKFQIIPEEKQMVVKFGEQFSEYCSKVGRWI